MDNRDIVEALRDLTNEVGELRQVLQTYLERSGPVVSPATVTTSPAAPPSPEVAPVLGSAASPAPPENAVQAEVRSLLGSMFVCALDDDEELAFERFIECMHSDRTDAPRSIPSLREFNWKSIRKNVRRYLRDEANAHSFEVERMVPEEPSQDVRTVKVFLTCGGRSPVPVTFKRDVTCDDAFRVTDSSL